MKRTIALLLLLSCASFLFAVVTSSGTFNVRWNVSIAENSSLVILDPLDTSQQLPSSGINYSKDIDFPDGSTKVAVAVVRFTTNAIGQYYMTFTATPFIHEESRYGYDLYVNNTRVTVPSQQENVSRSFNFSISKMSTFNKGVNTDYSLGITLTSFDEIGEDSPSAVVTIEVGTQS